MLEKLPNPLYIFTPFEQKLVADRILTPAFCEANSVSFNLAMVNIERNGFHSLQREFKRADKTIISLAIPATLKIPHHVHENGEIEKQPGRDGPVRTYFDGSSIGLLGHAVAVCVDNVRGAITTQCPQGLDIPDDVRDVLVQTFPGMDHVSVRVPQQKDQHSCVPLTIYNCLALAGAVPAKAEIDIRAWRGELMGHVETAMQETPYLKYAVENFRSGNDDEAGFRPVFRKPYLGMDRV